ncbi:hypothetical protein, partial [Sansalvadorimonas verongulae]|uniref:hypothetical protein n=1 Tax=Sansalvadorimonas verongulae TaxID=2172824 RepID=UPI001E4FDC9F
MHSLRKIACLITFLAPLLSRAEDIMLIHLNPVDKNETHEIYILPLLRSQKTVASPPLAGVLKAHWEVAELDQLNIPEVNFDDSTELYLFPDPPSEEEYELAPASETQKYSISGQQLRDSNLSSLNELFSGYAAVSKLKTRNYGYRDSILQKYSVTHHLELPPLLQLTQIIKQALEALTKQTYDDIVAALWESEGGTLQPYYLLSGSFPSPNGTPVGIYVYKCGLVYIEAPQDAFLENSCKQSPRPVTEEPPVTELIVTIQRHLIRTAEKCTAQQLPVISAPEAEAESEVESEVEAEAEAEAEA